MNINMCVGEGTGARDQGAGRQGVGGLCLTFHPSINFHCIDVDAV